MRSDIHQTISSKKRQSPAVARARQERANRNQNPVEPSVVMDIVVVVVVVDVVSFVAVVVAVKDA